MSPFSRFAVVAILAAATVSSLVSAQENQVVTGFDVTTLAESKLPQALSDMTAVLDANTSKVYIHGGCNATDGNVYDSIAEVFTCGSISSSSYVFDISTRSFTELNPMPTARYRHAAVIINSQVWLVGGRNLTDSVVGDVDMYDIATDAWTTFTDLDEAFYTSDHAAFVLGGLAYFVAGYNATYTAIDTVFTIDTAASIAASSLVVDGSVTPLPTPRGDVSAITAIDASTGQSFALVTGGFTHENQWCTPLSSSERFDVTSSGGGVWTETADLQVSRADKALVVLNDNQRIFALGGETKLPGPASFCGVTTEDEPEPGEETVPIVDVEWYDASSDTWTLIANLPRHRFRFVAVGYQDSIFSFGGQLGLDRNCSCFKTSDEVIVYTEVLGPASAPATSDADNGGGGGGSGTSGAALHATMFSTQWIAFVSVASMASILSGFM